VNISDPILPPVALIAGPTASGKTALALALAERIGGSIVNADASQVYADLRILTARPSPEEEARAPHRLFGHVDAACAHNVALWAAEARAAIAAVHDEGRVPILVGGTGLYLRTLIDGIAPVPDIPEPIRAGARALAVADAHAALSREDPDAAARLRPSDTTRVARALEVVRATGRTLADWQCERSGGIGDRIRLAALILLPDAPTLANRIDRRFLAMIENGAMAEIDALHARRLDPMLPAMRAIGVPELIAWRSGALSRDHAIARAQAASRQYAKRQRTWFRHQPPPGWIRLGKSNDELDSEFAISCLTQRLTR
jgi:tRNA dimethylallyltransferase